MRYLSVCAGIEAASVAWAPLGWRARVMAEIEAFPITVLKARHQAHDARRHVPAWAPMLWGDFTSIKERFLKRFGRSLADIDVLVGGTPCQAFSVAGLRRSLDDDRGNLSLAFVRLANAIDAVRLRAGKPPVWIVWENVPGVLSTRDNAFGAVLGGLVGGNAALDPSGRGGLAGGKPGRWTDAGVVAGPRRCAAWRILDAQHFGLAQRRRRIFVVARGYFGGAGQWDGPDALLPVGESCGWHPAPRREAGQRAAGTLSARTQGGGGLGTDFDLDGGLIAAPDVAATLTRGAESGGKGGYAGRRQEDDANIVAHSVTTRVGNASRNAGANGNLAVVSHCLNAKGGGGRIDAESETFVVAHTLKGGGFDASEDGTGRGVLLVPVAFAENSRAELRLKGGDGQTVAALKTGGGKPGQSYPAIAYRTTGNDGVYETGDQVSCLNTATDPNQSVLLQSMAVRRLTPRECERLQGFPDDYTAIEVKGRPAKDGPRYKALGNSMAVPVMAWIGARIDAVHAARHVHETRKIEHEGADMASACT